MPAAAAALPGDALWRPWADLPLDLLRDISRRLHATTDYVHFHATCKPWRDTLPPAHCYPAFLPWLLAPPDDSTRRRKARCVFSSSKSIRRGTADATEILVRDRRWVISMVDGTAVSTLASTCCGSGPGGRSGDGGGGGSTHGHGSVDLWSRSAASASATPPTPLLPLPLPPFSCDDEAKWWMEHADGVVSGDGTIFLFLFGPVDRPYYNLPAFNAALLHPGDASWTMVQSTGISYTEKDSCSCIAYHDGKIVSRGGDSDRYWSSYCSCIQTGQDVYHHQWQTQLPSLNGKTLLLASYLLESKGELLLANVVVVAKKRRRYTIASFVDGLSVSVYALQEEEAGKTEWVPREGRSLSGHVMFLGKPSSFAVDATLFGETSGTGGCAYFVTKNQLFAGSSSKWSVNRCRVFKYSFLDNRSELVEQLPEEWDDATCMWLTPPQPSISAIEEIRQRLEPSHRKDAGAGGPQFGPYFRIYVGNLPPNVDSYRLGQFFSKHGKVADARVMCQIKTKRSRGFGFVTLATKVGDDQEHAIAKLDGQILDGRSLRVKFADQKHHM